MKLDHITIAARDLALGQQFARNTFGVELPTGGFHPLMGTHNLLTQIDEGCFLEIIACHPTLPAQRRRWFGLDDPALQARIADEPTLIGWVLGVQNIDQALAQFPFPVGPAIEVTRGDLRWKLSVPDDGSLCLSGVAPTMIEWPAGPHPSSGMPDVGIRLESLSLYSPQAAVLSRSMGALLSNASCKVKVYEALQDYLSVTLRTPKGLVMLTACVHDHAVGL